MIVLTDYFGSFRQNVKMNNPEKPIAETLPFTRKEGSNNPKWKKALSEALRKLEITPDDWTGEITIGIQNGGIVFVRKSETLK